MNKQIYKNGNHLTVLLMILLLVSCSSQYKNRISILPICQGAFDIKYYHNRPAKGIDAITYKIRSKFPPDNLILCIDNKLKLNGFKQYKDTIVSHPTFTWYSFNPQSNSIWEKTDKAPASYFASWVNEKSDLYIWSMIDYPPDSYNKLPGTVRISIQITMFSEYKKEIDSLSPINRKPH
jgi:hypothetical protein